MVSYIRGLSKNHNKKTFLELQVFLMKIMAEDRVPCQLGMHFKWAHFGTAFDATVFIGNFVQVMQLLNLS